MEFKSLVPESATAEDMFTRKNLPHLREAIENLSVHEDGKSEKHGLKLNYNAIILRTIKSLKGFFTETSQDDKFDEFVKFHQAYLFRSPEMFSNARYKCISNSLDKSRKPHELPDESDVKSLKVYLSKEIERVSNSFDLTQYHWLRSLVVTRLTLFNGRRGEEPSRMLLQEFQDASDNEWLPEREIEKIEDEAEKYLLGQFRLTYLHGKGRKYVPVLLPEDLLSPIQLLIDNRAKHGIQENNNFVFATKHSKRHCSGWHAVKEVADKAKVKINATKNRHRISTLYAGLHMDEGDKSIFFDHMGHDPLISKENYQCPQGVREIQVMGPMLQCFDTGDNNVRHSRKKSKKLPCAGKRQRPVISESEDEASEDDNSQENRIPVTVKSKSGKRQKTVTSEDHEQDRILVKSISVCWTDDDNTLLHNYFKDFFLDCSRQDNNCGQLPSKEEIMTFLSSSNVACLSGLSKQQAYTKTRTKLFNERKTARMNLRKNLKDLTCM